MTAQNIVTFGHDHEHRKVTLSPLRDEIVKNINLVYYAPGVFMPPHSHSTAQFSTLLAGHSQQSTPSSSMEQRQGVAEYKPIDFNHSNRIGPQGAILLSININANNDAFLSEFGKTNWHLSRMRHAEQMWKTLCSALFHPFDSSHSDLETMVIGLLEDANVKTMPVKTAPNWLRLAEQALMESDMSIAEIAKSVGVHRVHLCRAFQGHFGQSVSYYRQRLTLQRGVTALIHGQKSIGEAGYHAGFADQSHFSRVLKHHFGITPRQLKQLF